MKVKIAEIVMFIIAALIFFWGYMFHVFKLSAF